MANQSDDRTINGRRRQPTLQELAARRQMERSKFGRLGRLRSWGTTLVGLLALLMVMLWIMLTR